MVQFLRSFMANRQGATAFDVALVVALIAIVLFAAVDALGGSLLAVIDPLRGAFD